MISASTSSDPHREQTDVIIRDREEPVTGQPDIPPYTTATIPETDATVTANSASSAQNTVSGSTETSTLTAGSGGQPSHPTRNTAAKYAPPTRGPLFPPLRLTRTRFFRNQPPPGFSLNPKNEQIIWRNHRTNTVVGGSKKLPEVPRGVTLHRTVAVGHTDDDQAIKPLTDVMDAWLSIINIFGFDDISKFCKWISDDHREHFMKLLCDRLDIKEDMIPYPTKKARGLANGLPATKAE